MSETTSIDEGAIYCEWCGTEIVEDGQRCFALDEGVCRP